MEMNMEIKFEQGLTIRGKKPNRDIAIALLPNIVINNTEFDTVIVLQWLCFYAGVSIRY